MLKAKSEYYIFLVVLYLFVFQFGLMQAFPVFAYWDEIYALMAIPLYLASFKGKVRLGNVRSKLFIGVCLFILAGLIGNFIYRYQVVEAVIKDVLLNAKFVLGILTTYYFFGYTDIFAYRKGILRHVHIIISVLFFITMYDEIFKVFPSYSIRYGIRAEQLFYTHPTELASVAFFLLLLNNLFSDENRISTKYMILASLVVASSLRMKSLVTVAIFIFFWFVVIVLKKDIKLRHFIVMVPVAIYIAWDKINQYFFSSTSMQEARTVLTYTSIEMLKNYFPFGAGLGTFASAPSADYYSPVYYMYNISNVWGLTPDAPTFVSDTFWPMVLGQTGFIGLLLFLYIVFVLFRELRKTYKYSKGVYLAGMGALLYLLVSSTAESSFVSPVSLPLSIVIGFCVILNEHKPQNEEKGLNLNYKGKGV